MKTYQLVNCWPHMQPHNFKGRSFDVDCPEDGTVFVLAEDAAASIAELEKQLQHERENPLPNGRFDTWQAACGKARQDVADLNARIAELESELVEMKKNLHK